jgi:hypothetical protein
MADTHLVLYDNSTGYVHAIYALADVGTWDNSGTYQADGYLDTSTGGHVATDLGSTMRCASMDTPTYDSDDYAGFGALEVDNTTTPTDTQQRTDGDKIPDTGGRDGDDPDYVFA